MKQFLRVPTIYVLDRSKKNNTYAHVNPTFFLYWDFQWCSLYRLINVMIRAAVSLHKYVGWSDP